MITADQIVR